MVRMLVLGMLVGAAGDFTLAQGSTQSVHQMLSSQATNVVSGYLAAAGEPTAAAQMLGSNPTVGIFMGNVPKGTKAVSTVDSQGDSQGRFVIIVPRGLSNMQIAARALHEIDHRNNNDPSNPAIHTAEEARGIMCIEARANCAVLAGMLMASTEGQPLPCGVVRETQEDAYANHIACVLGVGISGPVQTLPCPESARGAVPCSG